VIVEGPDLLWGEPTGSVFRPNNGMHRKSQKPNEFLLRVAKQLADGQRLHHESVAERDYIHALRMAESAEDSAPRNYDGFGFATMLGVFAATRATTPFQTSQPSFISPRNAYRIPTRPSAPAASVFEAPAPAPSPSKSRTSASVYTLDTHLTPPPTPPTRPHNLIPKHVIQRLLECPGFYNSHTYIEPTYETLRSSP
jgi:hypothetical protein